MPFFGGLLSQFTNPIKSAVARRGLPPPTPAPELNPGGQSLPVSAGNPSAIKSPRLTDPRDSEIPNSWYGGAALESPEEGAFLNERGMIRPENDFSWKERLTEGLKSGGTAAMSALARGGDVGAGLGAFAAGAGFGAYDPRVGARGRYEMTVEPEMMARREREQKEAAARGSLANQQLEGDQKRAQIGRIQVQNEMDQREEARRQAEAEARARRAGYMEVSPGATIFDSKQGEGIYTAPGRPQSERLEKPRSMADVEAEMTGLEGTPEQIAQSGMPAREASLRAQLPPKYQAALANPAAADTEILTKAQDAYRKLYQDEYNRSLEYTRGERKRKAAQQRGSSARPSSVSIAPRNARELSGLLTPPPK